MKNNKIKKMTGIAVFTAILVVMQVISNYVTIGNINLNLTLVPIVLGSIIYGPLAGAFLGAINGIITIFAPSTAGFLTFNPFVTIILCIAKTTIAGTVSGWIFKLLSNKNYTLAIILSSMVVPIINTGLFVIGTLLIFMPLIEQGAAAVGEVDAVKFLFIVVIGINFIVEFSLNAILCPTISYIVKIFQKHYNNKQIKNG